MRRGDRAIAIALGIVLGLVVIALFVFVFSEQTVDAPRINNGSSTTTGPATGH